MCKKIEIKTATTGELVRYTRHSPLEIVLGFSGPDNETRWVHLLRPDGIIAVFPTVATDEYEALLR